MFTQNLPALFVGVLHDSYRVCQLYTAWMHKYPAWPIHLDKLSKDQSNEWLAPTMAWMTYQSARHELSNKLTAQQIYIPWLKAATIDSGQRHPAESSRCQRLFRHCREAETRTMGYAISLAQAKPRLKASTWRWMFFIGHIYTPVKTKTNGRNLRKRSTGCFRKWWYPQIIHL